MYSLKKGFAFLQMLGFRSGWSHSLVLISSFIQIPTQPEAKNQIEKPYWLAVRHNPTKQNRTSSSNIETCRLSPAGDTYERTKRKKPLLARKWLQR